MAARKEYSQEHKGKTTCLLKGFVLSYVEKKKKKHRYFTRKREKEVDLS